jgi:small subunit ribosomal protein S17
MARQLTGKVASDKNDKTIVISVASRKTHPIYKKQYTRNTKFMAHDEQNEAKTGDLVIIRETRPLSAKKRFILERILEKAHAGFVETDATADVPEEPKEKQPVNVERPVVAAEATEAALNEDKPKKAAKSKKAAEATDKESQE